MTKLDCYFGLFESPLVECIFKHSIALYFCFKSEIYFFVIFCCVKKLLCRVYLFGLERQVKQENILLLVGVRICKSNFYGEDVTVEQSLLSLYRGGTTKLGMFNEKFHSVIAG